MHSHMVNEMSSAHAFDISMKHGGATLRPPQTQERTIRKSFRLIKLIQPLQMRNVAGARSEIHYDWRTRSDRPIGLCYTSRDFGRRIARAAAATPAQAN